MTALSALRTQVFNRLGVPSGDALLTSAVVDAAINAAINEIESEQSWPWYEASETINTVAGTATYTPAAGWRLTRAVKPADDFPLERYSLTELDDMYPFSTTQARPSCYAIDEGKVVLRPVPDAVYVLSHRYVKAETALSADADAPLVPSQFSPAIAALACHIVLGRSREDGRSAAALEDYVRWLSKMRRYSRRHTGPVRIRTRWDG